MEKVWEDINFTADNRNEANRLKIFKNYWFLKNIQRQWKFIMKLSNLNIIIQLYLTKKKNFNLAFNFYMNRV